MISTSPQHDRMLAVLKSAFGYDGFRPQQEEIISTTLAGRDVFALLPTGGGKSLCYQLPALLTEGVTVVVSPLIALMKDQVDALEAAGVAATFLNSTLSPEIARERLRGLEGGRYRLLYVAPERLFMDGFIERLKRWNVSRFAIDEAHCISEWGHDFRPEYRRLGEVRRYFPDTPIIAMTATATERVRADIIHHLNLHNPDIFVASFNRPNLSYQVLEKSRANEQCLQLLRARGDESGIIYCSSRKNTEAVAEYLQLTGIAAAAYHAGLPPDLRSATQEAFLRDRVRVICATTAFGMGVNKPNVRFVIHYDLPKSIEGYYQETGRAGRDGLPGYCYLLFGRGDVARQARQIEEKPEGPERKHAFAALAQMVNYAESLGCRRAMLLGYFGECRGDTVCEGCDNCLEPRDEVDATVDAQKFLSCVVRVQQSSGFALGLRHLVDILLGKINDKISRFGHDRLSTFGIGRDRSRKEWEQIGRELTARGFIASSHAAFPTISLTPLGRAALVERRPIQLRRIVKAHLAQSTASSAAVRDTGEIDQDMFEGLRMLRRKIAEERDVPAYIIFSDVTLRELALHQPGNATELRNIHGIGEKKAADFGDEILDEINRLRGAGATDGLKEVRHAEEAGMPHA